MSCKASAKSVGVHMLNPSGSSAQRRLYQAAIHLFAERGIDQVSISDLAERANVARGTVYNHIDSIESLFEEVASTLTQDMNQRVLLSLRHYNDNNSKLAAAIRLYIKRAHEEPEWGLFISRFGFISPALRQLGSGVLVKLLLHGMERGHYQVRTDQLSTALVTICSSVIGAMYLVREGLRTWRDAGSDCAEMVLRALGLSAELARAIAQQPLQTIPATEWQALHRPH